MKLELLVGMVASGKSTYARKRADEGALVIAHDGLCQMLHGGAYRYEQGLRECYRAMEEALADRALRSGREVVIDRTHLTRESRKRWLEFMAHYTGFGLVFEVDIVAVTFPILSPITHAERRFVSDPRGRPYEDWLKVAEHHYTQAMVEPLDKSEGFAAIISEGFVAIPDGETVVGGIAHD
jgi:hypothetical protein